MPNKVTLYFDNLWRSHGTMMYWYNFLGLFAIGCLNNLNYVIINSQSQDISKYFNEEGNIGIIILANVSMGLLVQSVNTFFLQCIPHSIRITANGLIGLLGLSGVAFSMYFPDIRGYIISVVSVMAIGTSSTFGEIVILGYLKIFPNDVVSGWGSGTGMAGVAGAGLALAIAPIPMKYRYFVLFPLSILYFIIWFTLIQPPPKDLRIDAKKKKREVIEGQEPSANDTDDIQVVEKSTKAEKKSLLADDEVEVGSKEQEEISTISKIINKIIWGIKFFLVSLKKSWWWSLNLLAVYWFEYVIVYGCANARTLMYSVQDEFPNVFDEFCKKNAFYLISLCYQIGVIISRTSLKCFKIRQIWMITVFQGFLLLFWVLEGYYAMTPIYLLFPLAIVVGLLGGASYVNVYYLFLTNEDMTPQEREFCVNLCALGVTVGITSSSFTTTLFNWTIYAPIIKKYSNVGY